MMAIQKSLFQVVGNMAEAMGGAGPALTTAVIQCVNQPGVSTAVQQAAIQVFRLTAVPEEVGTFFRGHDIGICL